MKRIGSWLTLSSAAFSSSSLATLSLFSKSISCWPCTEEALMLLTSYQTDISLSSNCVFIFKVFFSWSLDMFEFSLLFQNICNCKWYYQQFKQIVWIYTTILKWSTKYFKLQRERIMVIKRHFLIPLLAQKKSRILNKSFLNIQIWT